MTLQGLIQDAKNPAVWILVGPSLLAMFLSAGTAIFCRNQILASVLIFLSFVLHLVGTVVFGGLLGFGSFGMGDKKMLKRVTLGYLLGGLVIIGLFMFWGATRRAGSNQEKLKLLTSAV